jgi:putative tricarboxylic transport membrane protein
MAIALLVPFTYNLPSTASLMLLGGVYVGAQFGGSIAAILINVPGTPAAIATTFDGYPMTRQGKAMEALTASVTSSWIGGVIGVIALLFLSPLLATLALSFGPPEYFWLGILGITIIGSLTSGSITKGLAGGALGVLISTVGYSPFAGVPRFTFGAPVLLAGVNLVVALIGLFSIPEVLELAEQRRSGTTLAQYDKQPGTTMRAIRRVVRGPYLLARSSIIGILVGIVPGAGGNVAGLLSYREAVRASREPKKFGAGAVEGVIASETASNAEVGGSLIPLLTLGIPGAPQAAVLLGALLLHGLRPGHQLYSGHGAVITYAFILSLFVGDLMMFVVGLFGLRLYANLLRIPVRFLIPIIVLLSTVGAYAIRNNPADILVMFALGVGAYALKS